MNAAALLPDQPAEVVRSVRAIARERRNLNRSVTRAMPTTKAIDIEKANQIKHAHRPHRGLTGSTPVATMAGVT